MALHNHAPLIVAKAFGTLAAPHPDGVELGLGRTGSQEQTSGRCEPARRRGTRPQAAPVPAASSQASGAQVLGAGRSSAVRGVDNAAVANVVTPFPPRWTIAAITGATGARGVSATCQLSNDRGNRSARDGSGCRRCDNVTHSWRSQHLGADHPPALSSCPRRLIAVQSTSVARTEETGLLLREILLD